MAISIVFVANFPAASAASSFETNAASADDGTGNDTATGSAGLDSFDGTDGDDVFLFGESIANIDGGAGADTLDLSAAAAAVEVNLAGVTWSVTSVVGFGFVTNVENVTGGSGADTLIGDDLDNLLSGGDGDDALIGGAGLDTLLGGAGDDTLAGGMGRDSIGGGAGDDTLSLRNGEAADNVDGGAGVDLLDLSALTTDIAVVDLTGGTWSTSAAMGSTTLAHVENVTGGAGADYINGDAGNNLLTGNAGDDVLNGQDGADTVAGGQGHDTYAVDQAGDVVVEAPGEGQDQLFVGFDGYVMAANVEIGRLFGTATMLSGNDGDEQLVANARIGSSLFGMGGDDVLWGSELGDRLDGGAGSDTIRGGAGPDTMIGGDGVDIYVVNDLGDQMIETGTGGYDTAYVTVNGYTMPASDNAFAAFIEVAYLAGTATSINGSSSGENLVANPTAGSLLLGLGGNDILWGSDFADTIAGGTQDDLIYTYGGADRVQFLERDWGWDQIADFTPGEGDRLVFAAASGVTSFGQLTTFVGPTNTDVFFGANRITLYNYTSLNAADMLFTA